MKRTILPMFLAATLALSWGCAEHGDTSEYPNSGPEYVAGGLTNFPASADDLFRQADLVVVVRPTGERSEVWNDLETVVSSRFTSRIEDVLKGDIGVGETILLFAPGGDVKEPFAATESRRPDGSSPSARLEYVDWPFFRAGAEELLFLKAVTPDAGAPVAPFYYNLGPLARYRLEDGKLRSILAPSIDVHDPGGIRAALEGHDLSWLEAEIARADSKR